MPLESLIIPAQSAVEYPLARVSSLQITQPVVRGPLKVFFQLIRFREDATNGTAQDAPTTFPGALVEGSFQLSYAALAADPTIGPASLAINTYAIAEAIRQGLIKQTP